MLDVQELIKGLEKTIAGLQLNEAERDVWVKTIAGARSLASAGLLRADDVQSIIDELNESGVEELENQARALAAALQEDLTTSHGTTANN